MNPRIQPCAVLPTPSTCSTLSHGSCRPSDVASDPPQAQAERKSHDPNLEEFYRYVLLRSSVSSTSKRKGAKQNLLLPPTSPCPCSRDPVPNQPLSIRAEDASSRCRRGSLRVARPPNGRRECGEGRRERRGVRSKSLSLAFKTPCYRQVRAHLEPTLSYSISKLKFKCVC